MYGLQQCERRTGGLSSFRTVGRSILSVIFNLEIHSVPSKWAVFPCYWVTLCSYSDSVALDVTCLHYSCKSFIENSFNIAYILIIHNDRRQPTLVFCLVQSADHWWHKLLYAVFGPILTSDQLSVWSQRSSNEIHRMNVINGPRFQGYYKSRI